MDKFKLTYGEDCDIVSAYIEDKYGLTNIVKDDTYSPLGIDGIKNKELLKIIAKSCYMGLDLDYALECIDKGFSYCFNNRLYFFKHIFNLTFFINGKMIYRGSLRSQILHSSGLQGKINKIKSDNISSGCSFYDGLFDSYKKCESVSVSHSNITEPAKLLAYLPNINSVYKISGCFQDKNMSMDIFYDKVEVYSEDKRLAFTVKTSTPKYDLKTDKITKSELKIIPVGTKYSAEDMFEIINKAFEYIGKEYDSHKDNVKFNKVKELELTKMFEGEK